MSKSVAKSASGKRRAQKTTTAKSVKATKAAVRRPAKKSEKAVELPKLELPKHKPTTIDDLDVEPAKKLPKLPSVWRLLKMAFGILRARKFLFLGITAVYGGLSLALVQSLNGSLNLTNLKNLLAGSTDRVENGLVTFQWLFFGSGTNSTNTTTIYEAFLLVIGSLAIIWALRQVVTGQQIRIRDAYYRGMSSLVPVVLVALVMLTQLLPLLFGLGIFNLVISFGFADTLIQKVAWGLPALGLAVLSGYLVTSSIIALYIASLPDMEPGIALKNAKELVRYRRWAVLRKILFLLIILMLLAAVLLALILFTVPVLAPWLLFAVGVLILPVVHAYLYSLYRELLL